MKNRANTFFSIAIVGMVISLLSTNFDNSSVSTAYGEAEQTVFAEEGEYEGDDGAQKCCRHLVPPSASCPCAGCP